MHQWITGTARYPVYYEDTDFSGYVYHANYLKYFERGREDLVGLDYVRALYLRGLHFVVAKMELTYHAPARHGDIVEVSTRMKVSTSPVSLVEQVAMLAPKASGAEPVKLVSASIKLVAVNSAGEATRVPQEVVDDFLNRAQAEGLSTTKTP
jgi:acyl-CoA thioester hydrolase